MIKIISVLMLFVVCAVSVFAEPFEKDIIKTSNDDLEITFIGHGTLMLEHNGKVVHIDPYSRLADYAKLPKADLILITHQHGDHLDPKALEHIRTDKTSVIIAQVCSSKIKDGIVMGNRDAKEVIGIKIEAVPAYNIKSKRGNGKPYHPKGEGNGYVLTLGGKRVYVAGDTENTPEMKLLKNIDIAFLPMNLPYTMTPEMVADAAKAFKPGILYPYHFGNTDTSEITALLKNSENIEVRIRKMK